MSKQSGVSSVLAAAASFLVIGMVAVGTPAQAASEEDLAAPHGSFVSTMPVPAGIAKVAYVAKQSVAFVNSEEDLAAPHGSFISTMPVPGESRVRVAAVSEDEVVNYDDLAQATLRQAVAAALE
ncbi:MAG TPA: hypothetical protein VGI89_02415 [Rhizomicrobium sp.]|jgi:hypothetical protein